MSTRRPDRPFVRPQRRVHSVRGHKPTGALAWLAGADAAQAPAIERPTVERLEARQLLFSLTITPDMVGANGLGTIEQVFGYAVPVLQTTATVNNDPPETTTENLDQEPLGAIGSGRIFMQEGLVVFHTVSNPAANFRMIADFDTQGQVIQSTERIEAHPAAGQSYRFQVLENPQGGPNGAKLPMTDFTMTFGAARGSNQGITPDAVRVTLRLEGVIVREFVGAEIQQAKIAGGANNGVGTYQFTTGDPLFPAFDEVVVTTESGPNPFYTIDDFSWSVPAGNFVEAVQSRLYGAVVSFTGPVGASVTVLDLYGRDMRPTLLITQIGNSTITRIDPDDNGIPNFNDGIGQIIMAGTDSRASLRMIGGEISPGFNDDAFYNEGPFGGGRVGEFPQPADDMGYVNLRLAPDLSGLFGMWEEAGFGFYADAINAGTGFPPGYGSVVIGSPILRSQAQYNPAGTPVGNGSFQPFPGFGRYSPDASINPNQGVFVLDGSSFGDIAIHGMVYGSSRFDGALNSFSTGVMYGSLSVEGDLGGFYSASDAGYWEQDPDFAISLAPNQRARTGGQLVVGRTLRDMWVGGRNLMDVTVVGDVANPQSRPPLDQFTYIEREQILGVDEAAMFTVSDWVQTSFLDAFRGGNGLPRSPLVIGGSSYRNDLPQYAEFLGSTGTAVQVVGSIGLGDPAVDSNEDPSDVYAFATDGRTPVVIEFNELISAGGQTNVLLRVIDGNGNTLAANNLNSVSDRQQRLVFTPEAPGIYYVVFQRPALTEGQFDPQGTGAEFYSFLISGIAPTNFGNYWTGASTGVSGFNSGPTINLLAGNFGLARVGTSGLSGSGQEIDPTEVTNTTLEIDDAIVTAVMSLSVARGNLYTFISGGDIEGGGLQNLTSIFVSGDLGAFITGQNTVAGLSSALGDVGLLSLEVGGRVGIIDIRGSVGQDDNGPNYYTDGIRLRTGTAGGRGDVGMIRIGSDLWAPTSSFTIAPGSVVGAFLVSQAPDAAGQGIYGRIPTSGIFHTGVGSDVRFVDFPRIDLFASVNAGITLRAGTPVELIDDGGATVRITVTGGALGVPVGFIRFLAVDGSEGVSIAQIDALDLTGRSLLVETIGDPSDAGVSIGRINLAGADANTSLTFSGPVELDVWQIVQTGGDALNEIINDTPGGDFVAIDVVGLNRVDLTTGDLGRTQSLDWGPRLYGPFLGVASGLSGMVGGALGLNPAIVDTNWSGAIFRPTNNVATDPGTAFLDDVGGPFDGFLNGLVVRTGNVTQIRVGGAVGDVILQGAGALLTEVVVNTDNLTPRGEFDGIVGSIYAPNINRIEVGDGLRGDQYAPLTSGGIFAENQIVEVTAGTPLRAANIEGRIWASSLAFNVNPVGTPAVGRVFVNGGDYINASVGGALIDGFWLAVLYDDRPVFTGDIGRLTGNNADFFRSRVVGLNINEVTLTGGYFDASLLNAQTSAGTITALGFRNSTLSGTAFEFLPNQIIVSGDLGSLQTQTPTGSIRDTLVDVIGSITQNITAGFITRSNIQVDNEIPQLIVSQSIRGSQFNFGRLEVATVAKSIRHSEIAGNQILSVTAGDSMTNVRFVISGPGGRLDVVSAVNLIQGEFIASAPIGSITTTLGDIDASITTTTRRGTVGTVTAGRDLILETDISRGLVALVAGRHIGDQDDPTIVLVRGNLTSVTAPNGQLYSDIRVGSNITTGVTLGAASALPASDQTGHGSIIAFGRIGAVSINGDFGGSIISYTGGIDSVAINNGSFLRGDTARPNIIAAYDGDITSLVITGGNLYGDVYADYDLVSLQVLPTADGVFGDVGVNPAFNASQAYDGRRNRLPVGVAASSAIQGPRIAAGRNIISVAVTGGSVFETGFSAGRSIQSITIAESVRNDNATTDRGSYFVAGDLISGVVIAGSASDVTLIGGALDLGADQRPGGVGDNSDIVQAGSITGFSVAGDASNILALAGIQPGDDGDYASSDDRAALGISSISNLTIGGTATNVVLRSDVVATLNKPGVSTNGGAIPTDDALTAKNNPSGTTVAGSINVNLGGGEKATITFAGAGRAVWNNNAHTLSLVDTDLTSSLVVTARGNKTTLSNLVIATNDDASLGSLTINAELAGTSSVVIDGAGTSFTASSLNTAGRIRYGGNLATLLVTGNFLRGSFEAKDVTSVNVRGSFGDPNLSLRNEAFITLTNLGAIDIDGADRGVIVIAREASTINVDGAVSSALIRVGSRLGSLSAGSMSRTRVSVGDFLGGASASSGSTGNNQNAQAVRILGDMFDSAIIVGGDLGSDAEIGGSRLAGDRVTSGFLGSVFIGGNFEESDIVAGMLRGSDGFFGTSDDLVSAGRSTIGAVTIVGDRVGSNRFTESYRISSSGSIGAVSIGGRTGRPDLNFSIDALEFQPVEIQITQTRVDYNNGRFVATLTFSQPIDPATIDAALSVREIRNNGAVQLFLISGEDYELVYNPAESTAVVTFARDVTEADLPVISGRPAPGLYSFVLDSDVLRGSLSSARLDGDSDGFARGDDYAAAEIVGDAGDKLTPGTAVVTSGPSVVHSVDFYGPVNLDVFLDRGGVRDSLADANRSVTIRGFIGDHPDQDVNYFRFGGDVDVYEITLQAGQILRVGSMSGSAQQATRGILDASGNTIYSQGRSAFFGGAFDPTFQPGAGASGGDSPLGSLLEPASVNPLATSFSGAFYVRQSGTYYIAVGDFFAVNNTATVPNTATIPNGLGAYSFSIEVFDDLDSGFKGDTDSSDGTNIVNAPAPSAFASPDATIVIDDYTFRLSTDPLGNQIVTGTNSLGVTSTWAGGVLTSTVHSAIGPGGLAGVPNQLFSDLDVYHLNNGALIANGTRYRVTLKVSEVGGDLGSTTIDNDFFPTSLKPVVQLAIFDTTGVNNATDAQLYLSPTQFTGNGGEPNTVLADDGTTAYGFDENGDFYVEFAVVGRAGPDGISGNSDDVRSSYAIYVQGAINSDYDLEIRSAGTGQITKQTQNIYIETNGGEINWLEAGGLTTQLQGYDLRLLGFTGTTTTGVDVGQFVLQRIVTTLQNAFDTLGLDVNISTDPSDFEFQPFSTIFLSNSIDPLNLTLATEYGYSQRSDPLNADVEDEAVVFVSSFATLSATPDDSGLTALADAMTAAVGRRAGELMGLRVTEDTPSTSSTFDIMAGNSPNRLFYPGNASAWQFLQSVRNLSPLTLSAGEDTFAQTDFIIGVQSSASLLERVLARN